MNKLYRRSEIAFAIVWIVAYVQLSSIADVISQKLGIEKCVTAAMQLLMVGLLFGWMRRNDLLGKYGIVRPTVPARSFLYYLPLAIIATAGLWGGLSLRYGAAGSFCWVVSMCCVGFLEEVIFRGLLFRAIERDSLRSAVIVSSLTFGIGHIVNLFNGSGQDLMETLSQVIFAVMVGFVLVLVLLRGGSLVPCIVFHACNNALSAFGTEVVLSPMAHLAVTLLLSVVLLGGYVWYLWKLFPASAPKR